VPDHISLWGLLIPIRRVFKQYINLRPVKLWPGIPSPLRDIGPDDVDMVIVRENTEGEYSEIGGRMHQGTPEELAVQEAIFTRRGTDRVIAYACELAARRSGRICSATKSNGIIHTMPFWDERFAHATAERPDLAPEQMLIDALAAAVVLRPARFDVIVASNLFGDILSDLAAAVAGSIGIAPSGNLNPERECPSMFEPVHGSAPDIAGRGIANPIGAVWSGAMMLEHLGEDAAAAAVVDAMAATLASGPRTPDLGGDATTADVTAAVVSVL
jgi:tartrate dehydrogenase/decarboxylase/D-malate dehydrogenase